jgi:hypothetical protein
VAAQQALWRQAAGRTTADAAALAQAVALLGPWADTLAAALAALGNAPPARATVAVGSAVSTLLRAAPTNDPTHQRAAALASTALVRLIGTLLGTLAQPA